MSIPVVDWSPGHLTQQRVAGLGPVVLHTHSTHTPQEREQEQEQGVGGVVGVGVVGVGHHSG